MASCKPAPAGCRGAWPGIVAPHGARLCPSLKRGQGGFAGGGKGGGACMILRGFLNQNPAGFWFDAPEWAESMGRGVLPGSPGGRVTFLVRPRKVTKRKPPRFRRNPVRAPIARAAKELACGSNSFRRPSASPRNGVTPGGVRGDWARLRSDEVGLPESSRAVCRIACNAYAMHPRTARNDGGEAGAQPCYTSAAPGFHVKFDVYFTLP